MPFTFAHPAAVLWCARWHASIPLSAFVIGSMSPDFEYFIRLNMLSSYSHTVPGIVTFCVPVGLVVFTLYHALVAPSLHRNLPRFVRERIAARTEVGGGHLRRLVLVSIALAFGAATHILWDGFTHGNGAFVLHWPRLGEVMLGLPFYKFLQHGSTLAGFASIACWFLTRRPRASENGSDRWYWPVAAVSLVATLVVLQQIRPGVALGNLVLQLMDGLFLALLTAGCFSRLKTALARN